MARPMGEAKSRLLRGGFDRRPKLESHGSRDGKGTAGFFDRMSVRAEDWVGAIIPTGNGPPATVSSAAEARPWE